jgi:hypothetical protein
MKRFLLLIIIFFSCEKEKIRIIPKDVEPFVIEFEHQAQLRGLNIDLDNIYIWFVSNEEMPEAMGATNNDRGRILIRINKKYWDGYELYPYRREALIMHELGHSALGRSHSENKSAIMYAGSYQFSKYKINKNEMLDELFFGS